MFSSAFNPIYVRGTVEIPIIGTVLFIEDEETLRHAVAEMLRKNGFQVYEAADGDAGLELFGALEAEIDVVLLDLNLPRRSGQEVLIELRRLRPGLKVVLATTSSRESVLAAMSTEAPWRFIQKPYRFSALADLLRQACKRGEG